MSSRGLIRRLVAPSARLRIGRALWSAIIAELARRGEGRRESGAFLLAGSGSDPRLVVSAVYYDDLDAECLVGGIHVHRSAYPKLWRICAETGTKVVADVHTHPGRGVGQSQIDRDSPMIAVAGHLALIVPNFAGGAPVAADVGVHEYLGEDGWRSAEGPAARRLLYVGRFA